MTASLYIHVPFCPALCGYCDFYSVPVKNESPLLDKYVERVLLDWEMLLLKYDLGSIPAVYLGGGTPSVLGAERIKRLLGGILSPASETVIGEKRKPQEITVEANPESADENFLAALREAGANRLSLGIQTFHEPSRIAIGRNGEAALLPRCLEYAAKYFPGDFSVDLISGLPFQGEKILSCDIEKVLEYEPAHVSLYSLLTAEGTPFSDAVKQGKVKPEDSGEADRLWICGRDKLEKNGYMQYEVSNFCRTGKESIHNMRYWRMENWLALGPAASATLINDEKGTGFRYTISPDADSWLERSPHNPPPLSKEKLGKQALIKETLLMGLRLLEGPDTELFMRRFGKSIIETIPQTAAHWRERGLLTETNTPHGKDKISLTKEGLLFLNRFLVEAFAELPDC